LKSSRSEIIEFGATIISLSSTGEVFWIHIFFTPGKKVLVRRSVGEVKMANKFQYQIQQAVTNFTHISF
jgi:hypothetical protein